ncbi:putative transposase ISAs1 family [Tenacibaculum dicentrarchi]|nr:putative transposase ISAs1 family [Tenacibaculum dicentrarchi]
MDVDFSKSISDAQLRRLLDLTDVASFQNLNAIFFKYTHSDIAATSWVSFDGKEIRGTIDGATGQKRGLNLVHPFVHNDKIALNGLFYNGLKDSEITCVRELLVSSCLSKSKIIFDALHTQHETLSIIEDARGVFITQVKNNQKKLLEDLVDYQTIEKTFSIEKTLDKGHGRIETRIGRFYNITGIEFNKRWEKCNLSTLIIIEREFINTKTNKVSKEKSYHISNKNQAEINSKEYFQAIRNHWQIESNNYLRDTTFREDKIKCFKIKRMKMMCSFISIANNLLQNLKIKNIKAKLEDINHDLNTDNELFRPIKFL